jgi:hypothetical protein
MLTNLDLDLETETDICQVPILTATTPPAHREDQHSEWGSHLEGQIPSCKKVELAGEEPPPADLQPPVSPTMDTLV